MDDIITKYNQRNSVNILVLQSRKKNKTNGRRNKNPKRNKNN